jgi:hypothetical protein
MGKLSATFVCLSISLLFIYCDQRTDPGQSQTLRVIGITETGPDGPDDFIGTIDQHDWDIASYKYLTLTDRYWIYPTIDTFFISSSQTIKLHNLSQFPLSAVFSVSLPFTSSSDSIFLSPLETASVYFNIDSNAIGQSTSVFGELNITISASERYKYFLIWTKPFQQGTSGGVSSPARIPITSLYPAYPNPADGSVRIVYSINAVQNVRLYVLDDKLHVVDTLVHGYQNAGMYAYTWLATTEELAKFSSGMYRIEMQTDSYYSSGDVLLQR